MGISKPFQVKAREGEGVEIIGFDATTGFLETTSLVISSYHGAAPFREGKRWESLLEPRACAHHLSYPCRSSLEPSWWQTRLRTNYRTDPDRIWGIGTAGSPLCIPLPRRVGWGTQLAPEETASSLNLPKGVLDTPAPSPVQLSCTGCLSNIGFCC